MIRFVAILFLFLIYSISPWFFLTDTRAEQIDNNEITGLWFGTYTANQGETSLLINIFNDNSQDTKAIFIFGPTYRNSSVPSGSFYMNGTYDKETSKIDLVGIEWIDRPTNYYMLDLSGIISIVNNKMRMTGGTYESINNPFPFGSGKQGDFLLIRRCVQTVLDTSKAQGFVFPIWISVEDAGRTKPYTSQEFGDGLGHLGEDYAYPIGRNVRAAYEGKVVGSGFHGQTATSGFGNYIIIRHEHPALPNNGVIYSFYAHLDKIFKQSDESVAIGEVIGEVGNTGKSEGPHLHFEIKTGADFGSGYTKTNFTSYTIVDSGMTYYRPSTFIETYRSLSPTQPKRISLPGVLKLLLDDTTPVEAPISIEDLQYSTESSTSWNITGRLVNNKGRPVPNYVISVNDPIQQQCRFVESNNWGFIDFISTELTDDYDAYTLSFFDGADESSFKFGNIFLDQISIYKKSYNDLNEVDLISEDDDIRIVTFPTIGHANSIVPYIRNNADYLSTHHISTEVVQGFKYNTRHAFLYDLTDNMKNGFIEANFSWGNATYAIVLVTGAGATCYLTATIGCPAAIATAAKFYGIKAAGDNIGLLIDSANDAAFKNGIYCEKTGLYIRSTYDGVKAVYYVINIGEGLYDLGHTVRYAEWVGMTPNVIHEISHNTTQLILDAKDTNELLIEALEMLNEN